jgi:hypothetical protein
MAAFQRCQRLVSVYRRSLSTCWMSRMFRVSCAAASIVAVFEIHGSAAGGYISPLLISGWPCCGLQLQFAVAVCFAVKAMPTDPWGQPLTPLVALQACPASALSTPAHGLARQTANPCTADGASWLGRLGLAFQARLAPLATRANFFSPILRRVANQNKPPAGPVPTKKIR